MSIEWVIYLGNQVVSLAENFLLPMFVGSLSAAILLALNEKIILAKRWALSAIISLLFYCLIPTEKTMYMMLGAHYLKQSDVPAKVELVINKKLNEYLEEKK